MRKGEIKIIVPCCSYPMHNGTFQKIAKKLEILKKKPLWCHFKPKYVKMLKKRENKNYRSVSFQPDA